MDSRVALGEWCRSWRYQHTRTEENELAWLHLFFWRSAGASQLRRTWHSARPDGTANIETTHQSGVSEYPAMALGLCRYELTFPTVDEVQRGQEHTVSASQKEGFDEMV